MEPPPQLRSDRHQCSAVQCTQRQRHSSAGQLGMIAVDDTNRARSSISIDPITHLSRSAAAQLPIPRASLHRCRIVDSRSFDAAESSSAHHFNNGS